VARSRYKFPFYEPPGRPAGPYLPILAMNNMKRTGILASAIAAWVMLSFTTSAGDKSTGMTKRDGRQFAQAISTPDEAQVTATIGLRQEATCFFAFLAKTAR
jgi:hypothetical protein